MAFRGFFQTKHFNITKPIWAIFITSLSFAIGNFPGGAISAVLIYILFFIFIDNIIYGVIYQKLRIFTCALFHIF
ncbi:CPBP family glutamic-type intramembrane protease [Clostridium sp.]